MNRSILIGFAALVLSGCGKSVEMKVENASTSEEWKYTCRGTVLSGFQWIYVGKASHDEAGRSNYVCYGYNSVSNFCSEVRYGGVFGAVIPCNLGSINASAYTWNKW